MLQAKLSVLYVDDEADLLELVKLFLESTEEFQIDTASSARAALELIERKQYDAIISDYQMPEINGIELLKIIRARSIDLPFILFTGKGREEVVIEAYEHGADSYVQKGGDPTAQYAELRQRLLNNIRRNQAEEALKKREGELRLSEERHRSYIDLSPLAFVITDLNTRFVDVNSAFCELSGYSRADIIGLRPSDLIVKEQLDVLAEKFDQTLKEGKISTEYRMTRKDGKIIPISVFAVKLPDQTQMAFIADITDREKAEEAVRESELEFRSLFEDNPDAISLVGIDGKVLNCNQAAARMALMDRKEIIGGTFSDMGVFSSDDLALFQRTITTMARGGKGSPIVSSLHRKDGSVKWVEMRASIVMRGGRPHAIQIIARDITERKRVEEALVQANRKLNLLSGITMHDIDNQMTVLSGSLVLLEQTPVGPKHVERLRVAEIASERISAMIQFTRTYKEIGINAPVWHEVRTLVAKSAAEVPMGPVRLINDVPAGLEVFVDSLILKVCYNLIENAVRYGDTITTIRFSVEERDGVHAIVCEDDGRGVSKAMKNKLFERGCGTEHGLGLFLSREILAITSITLTEEGEPGKGARFVMTLPSSGVRGP
jgi:PAS domain S-box-containing protein